MAVKVQDAVSDIVTTGTAQCPFTAYSIPKTTHEAPPPAADLGAGDPIDVGRPPGHASTHDLSESAISELLARPNSAGLDREMERERERERGREREKEKEREREREWDSDAVDAESDFEPSDDATNYYGEEDCADAFDDAGLSARYFDQE